MFLKSSRNAYAHFEECCSLTFSEILHYLQFQLSSLTELSTQIFPLVNSFLAVVYLIIDQEIFTS